MIVLLLACGSANAALLSRAGGQAYYDTDTNLTWVTNANLGASNTFGVLGINANGTMTWDKANEWIAAMNAASYLGTSGWRRPTVTDTGTPGCNFGYSGTDCGYNVDLATGEMARMFYGTLDNDGYATTSGGLTGCVAVNCLTNTGPFANLQAATYWTGTINIDGADNVWNFQFHLGYQGSQLKSGSQYVWAMRTGDIAPVPVPAAVWLLGSALALLGAVRRRHHQEQSAALLG